MRSCSFCNTQYKPWKSSRFVREARPDTPEEILIPACNCLKDKAEAAYQQHLVDERASRAMERFQRLRFENSDLPPADLDMPKGLWADPVAEVRQGNKYVITGPPGSSKTFLLKAIALKLCLADVKVRGGYVQWVVDELKDMDQVAQKMESLLSGQVLVLDDLDKVSFTAYALDRLASVVNHYDSVGRSILVSMNSTHRGLLAKLGSSGGDELTKNKAEALMSRLYNRAVVVEQSKDTPDFRLPGEHHYV